MIGYSKGNEWFDWRWQFKNRVKGYHGLKGLLQIPREKEEAFKKLVSRYHFAATPYYLSLINWDAPTDPIRSQCIPSLEEIEVNEVGSTEDPFLEEPFSPTPCLIHRYKDRALIISTDCCAVYCRHCNRKRNWGKTDVPTAVKREYREKAIKYISEHSEIREVILSGGDPLFMGDSILEELLVALRKIPHVQVIRIGTRAPVTLPMRIDDDLTDMLSRYRPIWINTHFNHPREITKEAILAIERLITKGMPVSNQAVLLRGVNDDIEILETLFTRLQTIGVRPYYLFHCDPVKGTDHFRTSLSKGIEIMENLWGEIGGLCIPHYVVDLPDAGGKALLMPNYLIALDGDEAIFRTQNNRIIKYPYREN